MKHITLTIILCGLSIVLLPAQDLKTTFYDCFQSRDTACQRKTLAEWEKAEPDNPELLGAYLNYHFMQGREEIVMMMEGTPPAGEALVIQDSLGNPMGYMGSEIMFDWEEIQKGLDKVSHGIELYPDRLDLRWGKVWVLGQMSRWDLFEENIIQAIDRSAENDNEWVWLDNEPLEEGSQGFMAGLQDYQMQLLNTYEDSLLKRMRNIGNAVLEYYPENVENLTNVAITHILTGEFEAAVSLLDKAIAIRPKDTIVLCNLAQCHRDLGNTEKALAYYNKAMEYGDAETRAFVTEELELLKK